MISFHTQYTGFFLLHSFQASFYCLLFFRYKIFPRSHVTFITTNFHLIQFPLVMDQFSATDIFNTSIRDLPRTRLIEKRRNLLTLLNGDAFYPLSTWPRDIQQLFWKKPIGDTAPNHRMDSYISTLDHTTTRNQESKTNKLYY